MQIISFDCLLSKLFHRALWSILIFRRSTKCRSWSGRLPATSATRKVVSWPRSFENVRTPLSFLTKSTKHTRVRSSADSKNPFFPKWFSFPTSSLIPARAGESVPSEKTLCQSAFPVPCAVCYPLFQAAQWSFAKLMLTVGYCLRWHDSSIW